MRGRWACAGPVYGGAEQTFGIWSSLRWAQPFEPQGKHAAPYKFRETGYEAIPYANWWTNTLWKGIGDHKISYVLVWRNHGMQRNGHMHYYAPYKGQTSANDFIDFYKLDRTLFEKDIAGEKLYQ